MAKRTIETGIYARDENRRPITAENLREVAAAAMKAAKENSSADRWEELLSEAERVAALIRQVDRKAWNIKTMGDQAEVRRDARLLSVAIDYVRVFIRCGKLLEAVAAMFDVGVIRARIEVRPFERFAANGIKQAERNRVIAERNRTSESELKKQYEAVNTELARQARRGKRISRAAAYKKLAKEFEIEPDTLKKNCRKYEAHLGK